MEGVEGAGVAGLGTAVLGRSGRSGAVPLSRRLGGSWIKEKGVEVRREDASLKGRFKSKLTCPSLGTLISPVRYLRFEHS